MVSKLTDFCFNCDICKNYNTFTENYINQRKIQSILLKIKFNWTNNIHEPKIILKQANKYSKIAK